MCVLALVPLPLGVKKSQATPAKQDLGSFKGSLITTIIFLPSIPVVLILESSPGFLAQWLGFKILNKTFSYDCDVKTTRP